jgi:hypothetical protein
MKVFFCCVGTSYKRISIHVVLNVMHSTKKTLCSGDCRELVVFNVNELKKGA